MKIVKINSLGCPSCIIMNKQGVIEADQMGGLS